MSRRKRSKQGKGNNHKRTWEENHPDYHQIIQRLAVKGQGRTVLSMIASSLLRLFSNSFVFLMLTRPCISICSFQGDAVCCSIIMLLMLDEYHDRIYMISHSPLLPMLPVTAMSFTFQAHSTSERLSYPDQKRKTWFVCSIPSCPPSPAQKDDNTNKPMQLQPPYLPQYLPHTIMPLAYLLISSIPSSETIPIRFLTDGSSGSSNPFLFS